MTTPQERAAAIAAQARAREIDQRARNRIEMPLSAAFIDSFTSVFGKCPYGKFTEGDPPRTVRWGKSPEERWTRPRK